MSSWIDFYNTIKADEWPDCQNEDDFDLLPEEIKSECINNYNYVPGSFNLKSQISNLLETNKSFCVLPFVHLFVNETNDIAYCCHAKFLKKHTPNFDFIEDDDYNDVRTKMKQGTKVPKFCNTCYEVEKHNGESYRMLATKEWLTKLQTSDVDKIDSKLVYYDVRNDSLCNLNCRMCDPKSSTQLQKEYKEIGIPFNINYNKSKLNEIVNYDTVEKIYIAGGEPTIMPEVSKLLTKCIENNRTDLDLTLLTNGTNVNSKFESLLRQLTNVNLTLSIDGYDEVNRYIRWPSDWKTITNNIEKLKQITPRICVNVTVSILNITRLYELVKFLESVLPNPPTIILNECMVGINDYYVPFNFPNNNLALDKLSLLKETYSYKNEDYFKNKVDYFLNVFQQNTSNIDTLRNFFIFNDKLDNHRGIYLRDVIPELEQFRKLTNE